MFTGLLVWLLDKQVGIVAARSGSDRRRGLRLAYLVLPVAVALPHQPDVSVGRARVEQALEHMKSGTPHGTAGADVKGCDTPRAQKRNLAMTGGSTASRSSDRHRISPPIGTIDHHGAMPSLSGAAFATLW